MQIERWIINLSSEFNLTGLTQKERKKEKFNSIGNSLINVHQSKSIENH
jgi:hypothetical protein